MKRSAAATGAVGLVAAGILALSLSTTPAAHSVYLPGIGAARQVVPDRVVIPVPDGITVHPTNTQLVEAPDGSWFVKTQAQAPIREIVWQVRNGRIVSVWDAPGACWGNNELSIVGGVLVLLCVDEDRAVTLHRVPGWVR